MFYRLRQLTAHPDFTSPALLALCQMSALCISFALVDFKRRPQPAYRISLLDHLAFKPALLNPKLPRSCVAQPAPESANRGGYLVYLLPADVVAALP